MIRVPDVTSVVSSHQLPSLHAFPLCKLEEGHCASSRWHGVAPCELGSLALACPINPAGKGLHGYTYPAPITSRVEREEPK